MSVTPTIEQTDTSLIFRFPKSSDLDLKVYNPAFFESLGVVATISIVNDRGEEVASSKEMVGGNGSSSGELTFPYSQFVYLMRRGRDDTTANEPEAEPIQTRFFSAISNAFSNVKTNIQSGLDKLPKSVPISPKEEIQTVKTETLSPLPTLTSPDTQPVSPPTTLYESIANTATAVVPPKPVVVDKPSTASIVTAPSELASEQQSDASDGSSSSKTDTPTYYWKVVVEEQHNPKRNFEKEFWGELMEEWFRDVLRLSELEKKWGVYIDGEFYTVFGRKIKIGRVIPYADAPVNTVNAFLQKAVVLENSLPAKYLV